MTWLGKHFKVTDRTQKFQGESYVQLKNNFHSYFADSFGFQLLSFLLTIYFHGTYITFICYPIQIFSFASKQTKRGKISRKLEKAYFFAYRYEKKGSMHRNLHRKILNIINSSNNMFLDNGDRFAITSALTRNLFKIHKKETK